MTTAAPGPPKTTMDAAQTSAPFHTPAAPVLTRDPDHLYWLLEPPRTTLDNLLGVTEVMVELGFESDDWYTEQHSSRGIVIHAELATIARGGQPFPFLDPDLWGWRKSGMDFLAYMIADGAKIISVEFMGYSPAYRFAGTIDLVVLWRGYEWVLDWKTGKASRVTRFKLAAYDTILGPTNTGLLRKRAAIEVQEDGGKARLVEYNGPKFYHDANRFLGYLNTARDMRAYGSKYATKRD